MSHYSHDIGEEQHEGMEFIVMNCNTLKVSPDIDDEGNIFPTEDESNSLKLVSSVRSLDKNDSKFIHTKGKVENVENLFSKSVLVA